MLPLMLGVSIITASPMAIGADFGPLGGDLLASCKSEESVHDAYCVGYLKAYRDWYYALVDEQGSGLPDYIRYCEPDGIDYREIKDAVVEYLQTRPEVQAKPRIIGVGLALNNAWPCPNHDVMVLQAQLRMLKYYDGRLNGFYDPATKAAAERYYQDKGIALGSISLEQLIEKMLKEMLDNEGATD